MPTLLYDLGIIANLAAAQGPGKNIYLIPSVFLSPGQRGCSIDYSSWLTLSPNYICQQATRNRMTIKAARTFPKIYACARQKIVEPTTRCAQIMTHEGVATNSRAHRLSLFGCQFRVSVYTVIHATTKPLELLASELRDNGSSFRRRAARRRRTVVVAHPVQRSCCCKLRYFHITFSFGWLSCTVIIR